MRNFFQRYGGPASLGVGPKSKASLWITKAAKLLEFLAEAMQNRTDCAVSFVLFSF